MYSRVVAGGSTMASNSAKLSSDNNPRSATKITGRSGYRLSSRSRQGRSVGTSAALPGNTS